MVGWGLLFPRVTAVLCVSSRSPKGFLMVLQWHLLPTKSFDFILQLYPSSSIWANYFLGLIDCRKSQHMVMQCGERDEIIKTLNKNSRVVRFFGAQIKEPLYVLPFKVRWSENSKAIFLQLFVMCSSHPHAMSEWYWQVLHHREMIISFADKLKK